MLIWKSCSHCHAENPTSVETCPECGHKAQRPRLYCDCAQCKAQAEAARRAEAARQGISVEQAFIESLAGTYRATDEEIEDFFEGYKASSLEGEN